MNLAESSDHFKVSLKTLGKTYVAEGASLTEALSALTPDRVAAAGVLTVTHNGNERERFLTLFQLRRLFSGSRFVREVATKNMTLLFDGL